RAVDSATQAIGIEAVVQALPLLQPAALSTATRTDLKAQPRLLGEPRERHGATGTEPPALEPLTRVPPGALLALVAVGLAVHLLLPQVSELRHTLHALHAVRWSWLAAGLGWAAASLLAGAGGGGGMVGAEPARGRGPPARRRLRAAAPGPDHVGPAGRLVHPPHPRRP